MIKKLQKALLAMAVVPMCQGSAAADYTVYFHNPGKSPAMVNCYVWQDDSNNVLPFPGETMTR